MKDVLPGALHIGISYDLFWRLCPLTMQLFINEYEEQQKAKDIEAWRAGIYIQHAVASALSTKNKYPKEPFGLGGEQAHHHNSKVAASRFAAFAEQFNRKKREGDEYG